MPDSPIIEPSLQDTSLGRDKLSREQEAEQALTTTKVSRPVAVFLCASFLMSLVAVLVIDWIPIKGLTIGPAPALRTAGPIPTSAELHDFEAGIEKHSYFDNFILPRTQSVLSKSLGLGDDKAYIGYSQWLYYAPDVDYVTGPGFLDPRNTRLPSSTDKHANPVSTIISLKNQLAVRGIALIVMPVPVKPMIDPEGLGSTSTISLQNASFSLFEQELVSNGVDVCDVSQTLAQQKTATKRPQYLRTDTHWTPEAMQSAAARLAQTIKEQVALPPGHSRYTSVDRSIGNTGDIAKMLRVSDPQQFGVETVHENEIVSRSGTPWQPSRASDILLLGDSFSNIYSDPSLGWGSSAGLAEQLSFDLGRDVDKIAINAGGAFQSRKVLYDSLKRGEARLDGKRLVVYEFAMRDLSSGDWRPLNLDDAGPTTFKTAQTGVREIAGRVLDIAEAPDPRQTVYPDCLIEMRIRPTSGASDMLAYTWGLRGGRLTQESNLRRGQTVKLTLTPWDVVEGRLGNISRIDLDDADPAAPIYWAEPEGGTLSLTPPRQPVPDVRPRIAPHVASTAPPSGLVGKFVADVRKKIAEAAPALAIRGKQNWLFFVPDARNATAGVFWGPNGWRASQVINPKYADPLAPIVDFDRQLKANRVELLLVLVPDKAAIYPDMLSDTVSMKPGQSPPRLDESVRRFQSILTQRGIHVVSLNERYLTDPNRFQIFYSQDTHWTPYGASIAAGMVGEYVKGLPWYREVPKHKYIPTDIPCREEGDLAGMLGAKNLTIENEECRTTKEEIESGIWPWRHTSLVPFDNWAGSPVVLIGDSYADRLNEPLSVALGFAPDLYTIDGSGGEQARIKLARFGHNLTGKKLVVWCFSSRELTEERGWKKVQVIK